jgi:hypothetical protein
MFGLDGTDTGRLLDLFIWTDQESNINRSRTCSEKNGPKHQRGPSWTDLAATMAEVARVSLDGEWWMG